MSISPSRKPFDAYRVLTENPLFAKAVQGSCLLVLGIVLTAGLWPFHAPRTNVTWLSGGRGLRFGRHGMALTSGALPVDRAPDPGHCSLEVWLQPQSINQEGTALACDSSADPHAPFALRQFGDTLAVQRYNIDENDLPRKPWLTTHNVFRPGARTFIALTSDQRTSVLYVDGMVVARTTGLGFSCRDLRGRLVLANSTVDDNWSGAITGVAVYGNTLTSEDVRKHFQSWLPKTGPALRGDEGLLALYLFDEGSGNVARERLGSGADLVLPSHYLVLHRFFLRSVWDQLFNTGKPWTRLGFWRDLAMNIFGFVPVGFVFMAYFCLRGLARPAWTTVAVGFAISLTIEVLQYFLPTRDSGMNDLITNTLGTWLGVLCYLALPWIFRAAMAVEEPAPKL